MVCVCVVHADGVVCQPAKTGLWVDTRRNPSKQATKSGKQKSKQASKQTNKPRVLSHTFIVLGSLTERHTREKQIKLEHKKQEKRAHKQANKQTNEEGRTRMQNILLFLFFYFFIFTILHLVLCFSGELPGKDAGRHSPTDFNRPWACSFVFRHFSVELKGGNTIATGGVHY